ncbi:MAG: DUF3488 domain-containing protein [Burkholderiales bacterium]|nr:DUF3488 domain-containing protein [Burkholderiales bacterium]
MLNRLSTLPREARDTLFLLAVIGWVLVPLVPHLPLWCTAFAAAILAWRGWLAWHGRPLPSSWWVAGLLAITVVATLASHRTVLGRDAGVTLTVVLLALKTLELRARRDAFVVFFLGFFVMLSNFFFSQSLPTAAAILLGLFGLLTALVNAHMPVGRPPLALAARTAGKMVLLGAPIMAALFMLFPRLAPLWGVPGDAMAGKSGLSSSMEIGSIASLALDGSIALRIRFEGPTPPQRDLYFRGPVFGAFDGRQWQPLNPRTARSFPADADLQVSGEPYRYQVTMEASRRPWLFVMEAALRPPRVPGYGVAMTQDLQWSTDRIVGDLIRYDVESYPEFRHGPRRFVPGLELYLQLPEGSDPRTRELAREIAAAAGRDTRARVQAVMDRLRTGGYTYTLEPGVFGQHTADEFWFDRKMGFCEHIASAFVVLMRAMEVPARIVTGYQGGEVNNVDGYWTLRQSDAHAWAEVWEAGTGWVRVDPTSAVFPGRTGAFQRLQAEPGVIAGAFGGALDSFSPGLFTRMRAAWEAVNNRWNQWVLNYSQTRQLDLLRQLGFDSPTWQDLVVLIGALLGLAGLGGVAWSLWSRAQHDPWLRLLSQARRALEKGGLQSPAASTPRSLAHLAEQQFGEQARAASRWLLRLEAQRYARESARHEGLAQLRREFRQISWPRAQ